MEAARWYSCRSRETWPADRPRARSCSENGPCNGRSRGSHRPCCSNEALGLKHFIGNEVPLYDCKATGDASGSWQGQCKAVCQAMQVHCMLQV